MASTDPVFAYLGPAGTYTDEAARAFAARLGIDEPNLFECASFDEVFDCVDRGKCGVQHDCCLPDTARYGDRKSSADRKRTVRGSGRL